MNQQIAYTYAYLSFLFLDNKAREHIKAVYLFGSAVRNELPDNSDIDLFISCEKSVEKLVKKHADHAHSLFCNSKEFLKWKYLGVTQDLAIKTGFLNSWELKTSIQSEGVQLYGPSAINAYERGIIITVELPKKHEKYVQVTRELFGRKEKMFQSKGLVEEVGGKQLGKNTFLISLSKKKLISDFLVKKKINYTLQEIGLPIN